MCRDVVKRLVIVAGPRSSGTRYFTGLLIRSGAVGDDGHIQRLDAISMADYGYKPDTENEARELIEGKGYVVLRRSIPHGNGWPNIDDEIDGFAELGCPIECVFWMQRDVHCTCSSMVDVGHEKTYRDALDSIHTAYRNHIPWGGMFVPVTYELLGDSSYVQRLFDVAGLDLKAPRKTRFVNKNDAHSEVRIES